ncbi:MAG: hypothetical protein ACPGXZ_00135 [Saprospiraceae bacterium]
MKANTILNKVRELLGMEVELATMMMADGVTKVEAETFEAENEVVVVTEDEQKIPVPVGEYEMEDGRIMVVAEEGLIKEMKAKEEEAPAEEEAKKEYEDKEEKEEEMEASQPVKKTVESIVKETFFSEMETLKKENEELKAKLETLSKVENEEVTENVTEETTEEKVEEKTELSEEVEPIVWNPENKEVKHGYKFAKKGGKSTMERIFEKFEK